VLHRRAAALLGAVGHVVTHDAGVVLVADLGLVADVDAEALQEALVSAASGGSVCVSSATTSRPAWRALSRAGTIAFESFGVIMKPLAPAEMRLSTAWT
jgi:hypothetical protein